MRAPQDDEEIGKSSLLARVRQIDISSKNTGASPDSANPVGTERLPVEQRSMPKELPEYVGPDDRDLTEAEEQWKAQFGAHHKEEAQRTGRNDGQEEAEEATARMFMADNPDDPSEYRYEFDGDGDIETSETTGEEEDYHLTVDGFFENQAQHQPRRKTDAPPKMQKNNKIKKKDGGSKLSTFVWFAIIFGLFYVQFCLD
jgi:hypothetical protein